MTGHLIAGIRRSIQPNPHRVELRSAVDRAVADVNQTATALNAQRVILIRARKVAAYETAWQAMWQPATITAAAAAVALIGPGVPVQDLAGGHPGLYLLASTVVGFITVLAMLVTPLAALLTGAAAGAHAIVARNDARTAQYEYDNLAAALLIEQARLSKARQQLRHHSRQ